MWPLHFLHMIAWGSGGISKGSFLWSGNVCGSCGHHRLSLGPSEVEATFPESCNCLKFSSNLLLLLGRPILVGRGVTVTFPQVHEVPSDPKYSEFGQDVEKQSSRY